MGVLLIMVDVEFVTLGAIRVTLLLLFWGCSVFVSFWVGTSLVARFCRWELCEIKLYCILSLFPEFSIAYSVYLKAETWIIFYIKWFLNCFTKTKLRQLIWFYNIIIYCLFYSVGNLRSQIDVFYVTCDSRSTWC